MAAGYFEQASLRTGFAHVRGALFQNNGKEDKITVFSGAVSSSNSNANGSLDTLDYAPPSREEILLAHIEKLLAAGDFEEAAEHILTATAEGSDLAFTGKHEAVLAELSKKTKDLLEANIAQELDDLRREEFLAFVRKLEEEEELRRQLLRRLEQEGYTPRPGTDLTL